MIWSKMKQQLESFLCEPLAGRVEYRNTSYRYMHDKPGRCYITVDKKEVFQMGDLSKGVAWYKTKEEIIKSGRIIIEITQEDIEAVRKVTGEGIPEDRIELIAKKRKLSECAEKMILAAGALSRNDFYQSAERFLSTSLDEALKSEDILLNVFAIVDRRLGKKRILNMEQGITRKHPIVQYFYYLRKSTL